MVCYALLNSSPIDERGDLCCERFVGALLKIRGTTRKFHGKPVNMNQRCKRRSTSTVTLKELWWRNLPNPIPSVNRFLWGVGKVGCWIGKIGEQISDPQRSTELANCKYGSIRPRQWSAKISRAGNSKHGYYSSQASTWQSRPLQPPRSHPTDHKEHRTHWIEINLALITFSHIKW